VKIAVDLGISGALATSFGSEVCVEDIPIKTNEKGKKQIDVDALISWFKEVTAGETAPIILMESVHAQPTGSIANFSMGYSLGTVQAIAKTLGGEVILIDPRKWKKALGLTSDKKKSLEMARKLFPQLADQLKLVKHHNKAEALLILYYYMKQLGDHGV